MSLDAIAAALLGRTRSNPQMRDLPLQEAQNLLNNESVSPVLRTFVWNLYWSIRARVDPLTLHHTRAGSDVERRRMIVLADYALRRVLPFELRSVLLKREARAWEQDESFEGSSPQIAAWYERLRGDHEARAARQSGQAARRLGRALASARTMLQYLEYGDTDTQLPAMYAAYTWNVMTSRRPATQEALALMALDALEEARSLS